MPAARTELVPAPLVSMLAWQTRNLWAEGLVQAVQSRLAEPAGPQVHLVPAE